jgi:epothilone synthetase B
MDKDRYSPFPLTDLQRAYWIARTAGLELGDVAVHCYQELEIPALDLQRLSQAWRRVIERHDMLRAVVLTDGTQRVLEQVPPYEIQLRDLAGLDSEAAEHELEALRRRLTQQVFPAEEWPLFTVCTTRLPGGGFRVHFALDGLLLDGWSYRLLFRDLVAFYRDPGVRLSPLSLSFRDYVRLERSLQTNDPGLAHERAAWKARLAEMPPPPALPVERARKRGRHPGFVRRSFILEAEAWRRLKGIAAGAGLTPTGVVLTAYAEVVAMWSGGSRFTLSLPRFNRLPLHSEVGEVVGEFASFSLLAVDLSRREPFRESARRLQEELWWVLEHGRVSGVEISQELARLRGQSGAPVAPVVFTSMLGLADEDASAPLLALGSLVFRVTQTPQVWLDCLVQEHAGELRCDLDVVAELFPPGVAAEMAVALAARLRDLAAGKAGWERAGRPELPADQLRLLAELNATDAPPPEELVVDLVRRRAGERPDAPAVIHSQKTLSYGELIELSSAWAALLVRQGVRPGQPVALVLEKGWEQPVGVLAILLAGAAFLPVDPAVPAARLQQLLAGIGLALTQSWLGSLPWPDGMRRLCLDAEPPAPGPGWESPRRRPEDLAYILFTSGSTGTPKGVMIPHLGLANALAATRDRFALGPDDRVLALTALHHDMSLFDMLGMLTSGGAMVLPERGRLRDPEHWLDLLQRHGITVWNSVPAMMEMLLELAAARPSVRLGALRLAFLGGDWIPVSLPRRLRGLALAVQPVSVGGPTETTLWNIWHSIGAGEPERPSIPYGRPIANNRYHVFGDTLDPCPVWVPGELYCAGVGLALGYWNDPEAEARAFVRCPRSGERLYRTGDLGRLLPEGHLEILGRVDLQVKLQGQRIELEEIEATLQAHPLVTTAAVVAAGERGALRLVAHVVLDRAAVGDRAEFKLGQPGVRRDAGASEVLLPGTESGNGTRAGYLARRSYRRFLESPLPFAALSALLGSLRQIDLPGSPLAKRRYPSAGGSYTVAVYLDVKPGRIQGVEEGIYHYDPAGHELVPVPDCSGAAAEDHLLVNREVFSRAAFSIYLAGDPRPLADAYGESAGAFRLLEAGAIGQLLMSVAAGEGVGLCPVGRLAWRLGDQPVLHTLLGGAISPGQREPAAILAEAGSGMVTMADALRAYLRERLPEPLVPASWCFPGALPLSPNGKVDRVTLARKAVDVRPGHGSAAPGSEAERVIAEMWGEALGGVQPGIDDNFFDLGGSSLQLIQIHRRMLSAFGRDLPLVSMFRFPTVRALAGLADGTAVRAGLAGVVGERSARQREALGGRRWAPPRPVRKVVS